MKQAVVLLALLARVALADHNVQRPADIAKANFPGEKTAVVQNLQLSDAELAELGKALGRRIEAKSYPYLDVRDDIGSLGEVFLLDVIGQSQPISFAVAIAADGTLLDVAVVVYRESHGEEIADKRFRRQFAGKHVTDPLVLGKDVDAISGATISSQSAAFAARKALRLAELLRAHRRL